MYVETQEIPHFTPSKLESLRYGVVSIRQQLLHQIITTFETRYNCSLSELEGKLENLEIDEHPAWEDSIEWRNGVEQLEHSVKNDSVPKFTQSQITKHPSLKFAGVFKDDPNWEEFQMAIASYRCEVDAQEGVL